MQAYRMTKVGDFNWILVFLNIVSPRYCFKLAKTEKNILWTLLQQSYKRYGSREQTHMPQYLNAETEKEGWYSTFCIGTSW